MLVLLLGRRTSVKYNVEFPFVNCREDYQLALEFTNGREVVAGNVCRFMSQCTIEDQSAYIPVTLLPLQLLQFQKNIGRGFITGQLLQQAIDAHRLR